MRTIVAAFEKQLRDKVVRLCLMLDLGVEEPVLRGVLGKATAEELGAMEKALEERTAECFPMQTQLPGGNVPHAEMESGFLIGAAVNPLQIVGEGHCPSHNLPTIAMPVRCALSGEGRGNAPGRAETYGDCHTSVRYSSQ